MTRHLLDTHALIWWWLGDPSLSDAAQGVIADDSVVFVSPVNAIEIAIKVRRGRLPVLQEPLADFDEVIARDGFKHLPITHGHAREAGLLPGNHGDPFDRLIAAQALTEDLTVITRDREIAAFGCKVLW